MWLKSILIPLIALLAFGQTAIRYKTKRCTDDIELPLVSWKLLWEGAVHGTHSMLLNDARHYYDPDTPIKNDIMSLSLKSNDSFALKTDIPLIDFDPRSKSYHLQMMDFYLRNEAMNFVLVPIATRRKLTHQFHMMDVWNQSVPYYKAIKENPLPNSDEICECIDDIENNDSLEHHLINWERNLDVVRIWFHATKSDELIYVHGYTLEDHQILLESAAERFKDYFKELEAKRKARKAHREHLRTKRATFLVNPGNPTKEESDAEWTDFFTRAVDSFPLEDESFVFALYMYCKVEIAKLNQALGF